MMNNKFYVVLGCHIKNDCTISDMQKSRMDILIKNSFYSNDFIILSGGYTNIHCSLSEADIMKKYAIENGINKKRLITEKMSRNTIGNAVFTMKLLNEMGVKYPEINIITSCFHMCRSYNIFKYILMDAKIFCNLCAPWHLDYKDMENKKWLMDTEFIKSNINNDMDNMIKNLEDYHN